VIVVDGANTVQGLADPAPLVAAPDPPDLDVVNAVRLEIATRRNPQAGAWIGFTRRGSGPPYTAYLVDDAGREICAAFPAMTP
jgi:hypothetical protein